METGYDILSYNSNKISQLSIINDTSKPFCYILHKSNEIQSLHPSELFMTLVKTLEALQPPLSPCLRKTSPRQGCTRHYPHPLLQMTMLASVFLPALSCWIAKLRLFPCFSDNKDRGLVGAPRFDTLQCSLRMTTLAVSLGRPFINASGLGLMKSG